MSRRLLLTTAAALVFAAPAHACLPGTGTTVFSAWGDQRPYTLLSKVDTNDRTKWSLSGGASITVDDSPFTGDVLDRLSIEIPAGAEAWSPAVCAGSEFAAFRFFARTANLWHNGSGGLLVEAILENGHVATYPALTAGRSWDATKRMQGSLGRWFDKYKIGGVRLRFRNASTQTYRVDDLHYDARSAKDPS